MYAQMDTVEGTDLYASTTSGYFIRTGLLHIQSTDLPALKVNADSRILFNALDTTTIPNMPAWGDILSSTWHEWVCVARQIKPRSALLADIFVTYRWLGALQIRDHLSLEPITTVINPGTRKPIYGKWLDPNPAPGITARLLPKLVHLPMYRVIRNITFTKTMNFTARDAVLQAKKCVNDAPWMGLDAGYWMVTDIDGSTPDGGITYTYSVTFSTRDELSWAEFAIVEDDTGIEVTIDPVKFNALVIKPYAAFSEDSTTCTGAVRVDLYNTVNFPTVFGVGPGAPTKTDLSGIM